MGLFDDKKKKKKAHEEPLVVVTADPATESAGSPDAEGGKPSAAAADTPRRASGAVPAVGHSTTFTGKIVANEDLEVLGTVEGSIQLSQHHLTVGSDGTVKADVAANSVLVIGRVTGSVSATDFVEVRGGGFIGGDVTAPRIIMADGAIVIGALDMNAALPKDPVEKAPPQPSGGPTPPRGETPTTVGGLYRTDTRKTPAGS